MQTIPYEYHNLPIPGGGYVTGIVFHEAVPGLLYIRTDIGGCYRYDWEKERWVSLIDHVSMQDLRETYPISLAVTASHPERLYIVCGVRDPAQRAKLCISDDYGETFRYVELPFYAHGNLGGRAAGERLIVDSCHETALYYASQKDGLWRSADEGTTWLRLPAMKEQYLTFAVKIYGDDRDTRGALIVGTAGVTTGDGKRRGHSLFVSYDDGETFSPLNVPQSHDIPGVYLNGHAAMRAAVDGQFLYVTFESAGPGNYQKELGYGCDGGQTADGRVLRYPILSNSHALRIGPGEDITPVELVRNYGEILPFGLCGVTCAAESATPLLAISTVSKQDDDVIYVSRDRGLRWRCVLRGLSVGEMRFHTPYMRPECNGGRNLIHWMSDLKINPFDPREAWFTTGTGIFRSMNFTDENVCFSDCCGGLEETVHLGVYAMPEGPGQVLDVVGDLGGFAFTDIDKPCPNSFANEDNDRYITCINADFPDRDCRYVLVTPRGSWRGETKGGLIFSRDYGQHFERIPMPWGLSDELDAVMRHIEEPNVNSGWAALSSDHQTFAWTMADNNFLPMARLIVSNDGGRNFHIPEMYDLRGDRIRESKELESRGIKVFADRMDRALLYGFGEKGQIYLSKDCGRSFCEYASPLPACNCAVIDCADPTEIRGEAGRSGIFYLALGEHGLWKLLYEAQSDEFAARRLTGEGVVIYRAGLGIMPGVTDYAKGPKAIYCCGIVDGEYGFFRSFDDAETFERINTARQMYGEINCIDGDRRVPGRFYLATGSRGLLYGMCTGGSK